jgi:hypothetical protein
MSELGRLDDVLLAAVESVTVAMAGAFDEIWSKPNAAQVMAGFLGGKVRFVVERDGVSVLVEPDAPPPPEPFVGMYL